jgi:protein O-GlcNAc transferase
LSAKTPLELLQDAAHRHGTGDLAGAELLYRAALHRAPHPVGQHLLGALLHQSGRFEEAISFLSQAAAALPDDSELLGNFGAALVSANRPAEALEALDRAIERGQSASAAVLVNRSAARRAVGDFAGALADAEQALALEPQLAGAYANAGAALQSQGKLREAIGYFLRGLEHHPNEALLETNAGALLFQLGESDTARAHLERAVLASPGLADARHNLGAVLQDAGEIALAEICYQRALEIDPTHAGALSNFGSLDLARGRVDMALAQFQDALASDPQNREAASNNLLALNYLSGLPPVEIAEMHKAWGARLRAAEQPLPPRQKNERPRIGFLSPDLWNHPVASFLEPLLRSVDRTLYDLHVYNDRAASDRVSERLRALPIGWTEVAGWPGAALIDQIRADGIDVLIDLSGHTAKNRLVDLAMRAAPVQMTMIGYPNTTGLPTMDYRITDIIADPKGEADARHSETLIRLAGGFLCWRPPDNAPTAAQSTDRPITFGSFNALPKLSAQTISAWAAILNALPNSRLVLKSRALSDPETRSRILRAFSAHRVAANRLELVAWLPATQDHLAFYSEIDVALDPFPYNGTTTTMEALWMGVPVVSLIGEQHAGRVGASILAHAGLGEDLATDVVAYVNHAIRLASSPELLAKRRVELRPALGASSLLDGERYARAMEAAWSQTLELVR